MSTYTDEEFAEFAKLVRQGGSPDQMERINARLAMSTFVKTHGKAKCDAMFAKLYPKGVK